MKYRFYRTSEKAWAAMLKAISGAQKTIYLESFILTDDAVTHHFFETLKRKAREGVQVKVVIDKIGHWWFGSVNKAEFERSGAEILFFNRWFYRSHRKVLIIDQEIAFLGGVNIRGEYAKWLDLHISFTGLLVKKLFQSFGRVYALAGGQDAEILRLAKSPRITESRRAIYRAKTWLIERWPIKGKSILREYYQKQCAAAGQSITIVTPYFIPHRWLINSLKRAAARGVAVEIIIPQKTDTWFADVAHRVFAKDLPFMRFFFLPKMNHAKVLLVDSREGMVGSNNIDAQSFDFNLEASVVFDRKDMVGDLKSIVDEWKASAISAESANNGYDTWYQGIVGWLIKLIQPIL